MTWIIAHLPDDLHERVVSTIKAALAEAGYPEASIRIRNGRPAYKIGSAPPEAAWRAGALVAPLFGGVSPCWPCWSARRALDCDHDTWDNAPPVVRPAVAS